MFTHRGTIASDETMEMTVMAQHGGTHDPQSKGGQPGQKKSGAPMSERNMPMSGSGDKESSGKQGGRDQQMKTGQKDHKGKH